MTTNETSSQLKSFIEKIEGLEEEKTEVAKLIRDAFLEAKFSGFDPKIMRQVLKCRKMGKEAYLEQEHLLGSYLATIGTLNSA